MQCLSSVITVACAQPVVFSTISCSTALSCSSCEAVTLCILRPHVVSMASIPANNKLHFSMHCYILLSGHLPFAERLLSWGSKVKSNSKYFFVPLSHLLTVDLHFGNQSSVGLELS